MQCRAKANLIYGNSTTTPSLYVCACGWGSVCVCMVCVGMAQDGDDDNNNDDCTAFVLFSWVTASS